MLPAVIRMLLTRPMITFELPFAVSTAMNHGGPFPSTGHPGFTAVGIPASITRFTALHCYDAVRPERLPPELGDHNPTGRVWRSIDGQWSQADVTR